MSKLADFFFWDRAVKVSCNVADILSLMTSRELADQKLLQLARLTRLGLLPRAREYLANFLSGKAETKKFLLSELLEDEGVRGIVARHFNEPVSYRPNVITIGQGAYRNADWQFSLGTYFIYYIELGLLPDLFGKPTRCVLAWGEDIYQWAPDDVKRFTKCIHEAASRLEKVKSSEIPKAMPFKMLATEIVMDTSGRVVTNSIMHKQVFSARSKMPHVTRQKPQFMCRGQ